MNNNDWKPTGAATRIALAQQYRFDVGKEVANRSNPGKPEWPQSLRINISRREAIDVMRTLLNQMTREDEPIGVTLFGELAEDPE